MNWPEIFLVLFFGLIWGSFFNVVIYRLPKDESVVRGRSKCPSCKKPIPMYLNIPVLSFLMLNGRSACCRKPISIQYPLVEMATAVAFLSVYGLFGLSPALGFYALLMSYLIIISVIDLHHRIIPDELSFSGIVLGILASLVLGVPAWWSSIAGVVLGGGIFWLIAWVYQLRTGREGLGGGDIKMMGMLGAWFGIENVPLIILVSTVAGSVVGVAMILWGGKNSRAALPFGPFLAAGAVAVLFWGPQISYLIFA